MSSNMDANNDKLTPEFDRKSQKIYLTSDFSSDQTQMQVARRESSSGFMLLSVKHLSNVKNSVSTNGREMHPLGEVHDDSLMAMEINCKALKGNSLNLGSNFASTISLEAEEYDNEEEEELESHFKPHQLLQSNPLIGLELHSSVMHDLQSNLDPTRIGNTERHTNGYCIVDKTKLTEFSSVQPAKAASATDSRSIPLQASNGKIPSHPGLFCQLNSDVTSGLPLESTAAPSSTVPHLNFTGIQNQENMHLSEMPIFMYSNPSSDSAAQAANAAAIIIDGTVPCQPDTLAAHRQLPTQRFNERNGEPLNSFSSTPLRDPLSPSFDTPIQPASRFRKARIHETIEQWALNRFSFHDCRLKVVPSWVSHLQTKPINSSLNHPIAQRGRCLYCYVPGSFGLKCNNPKHQNGSCKSALKRQKAVPCSLPNVPESFELFRVLQATITAYHSATQQGYNLSSLFTTWNLGERISSHALLEQVDRPSKNNNLGFEADAAESEHVEMSSYNSTDVNILLPLDSVDLGTHHQSLTTAVKHVPSSGSSPPKVNTEMIAINCISDPSAAYLRRQLDLGAVRSNDGMPHTPPKQGPTIPPAVERQMVPPASPAMSGMPNCVGRLLDCVDGAVTSPRTLDSVHSFSGTTITSVQLSPDTEVSEVAISNVSYPSAANHLALSDAPVKGRRNVPALFAFSDRVSSSVGGVSHAPMNCSSNSAGVDLTPVDLSAAARNIFQVATAAAACVNRQSQLSPHSSGGTSVSGNLDVQIPKCMDVIRLAIMDTLQDQFSYLNSENEALRAAVNNLQHENHLLRSYKQAFFDLRHFFQPEVWEQIAQQVRAVEAAAASTESAEQHHYYSLPPSQQNCAFQALPQYLKPSQLPPDFLYPLLSTSDIVNDLPPPPPPTPPSSPPHIVP